MPLELTKVEKPAPSDCSSSDSDDEEESSDDEELDESDESLNFRFRRGQLQNVISQFLETFEVRNFNRL